MDALKLNEIEQQMSDDLEWALTVPEVQQHTGQFVAVYKRGVAGVGTDRMALVRQRLSKHSVTGGHRRRGRARSGSLGGPH